MEETRREVRFQIDGDEDTPAAPPTRARPAGRTAQLAADNTREYVAREVIEESRMLMRSRRRWKKVGDVCEALSKGLAGVGTVLAYAASAIQTQPATDILAFTSGFVGTIGLTLFAYSSYSTQESRQRTQELNALLQSLGVTPMPELASYDSSSGADA